MFFFSYNSFILLYNRNYKQPNIGANLRSELQAADNTPNQTESMVTSNDAAVNTGMSPFSHPNPFPFYHKKPKT